MKKFLLAVLFLGCTTVSAFAQSDSTKLLHSKKTTQSLSIQGNAFIKQLINLSNTPTPTTNPYLLKYTIRPTHSRWGYQAGANYKADSHTDKDKRKSTNKAIDLRIGTFKNYALSKRMEASIGLDILGHITSTKTISSQSVFNNNGTDSITTTFHSRTNLLGAGLQANLTYSLIKNLIIGTEATYYYTYDVSKSSSVSKRVIVQNGDRSSTTSSSNDETSDTHYQLNLPVVIFIGLKF